MLAQFNGMWAFAIVNLKTEDIFASRDRFGIKPLYYFDEEFFALGSEVKALHILLGTDTPPNNTFIKSILRGDISPYGTKQTWLEIFFPFQQVQIS